MPGLSCHDRHRGTGQFVADMPRNPAGVDEATVVDVRGGLVDESTRAGDESMQAGGARVHGPAPRDRH